MAADAFDNEPEAVLKTRIQLLREELTASRALTARARAGLEGARERGLALRSEVASLQDQSKVWEEELARVREAAEALSADNGRLAQGAADAQADLAAARQHVADLTQQIELIRRSLSWRLTGPLRVAGRILRKLAAQVRGRVGAVLTINATVRDGQQQRRARREYETIAQSGLFDPDWYRSTYADVAASGVDPLHHYLTIGWTEGRRPGPAFDPDFYRFRHPDILVAGLDPFRHYVLHGRAEGRESLPMGEWTRPETSEADGETAPMLPAPEIDPSRWPRIAVAIHAFYPDVFDGFCARLAEIPVRFTLLVSTPSEGAKAAVERSIATHGLNVETDIRVTPNRGRNFGPLLSEFSSVILEHDLLLHLHTKKSLHNASGEQIAWRDDIFRGLIAPGVINSVVSLFLSRRTLGLVYTRTFNLMAYWANHWLQNGHHAGPLFRRLGVGDYVDRGYINYPVGGMFWARVDAIRPLFEAGLSYEDFPKEAGQLDGTIAHAIERCFVDLARWRGFTFAESVPHDNLFRLGWSDRNLDRYALNTLSGLKTAINRADLVSFDLFDTLLQRPSLAADAVQRFVGVRLHAEHPGAPDFFTARKAAEHAERAARNFDGDVDLDAIYARMASMGAWSADALARARSLELEVEVPLALTRKPIVEALRHARGAGKRVIAISDTYFVRTEIDVLLKAAGLDGQFDEIYLSSEQQARKDRGDLWTRVAAAESVPASRWLHIGDNEVSDMQRGGDTGIAVYHAMNPAVMLHQKGVVSRSTVQRIETPDGWADALLLGPLAAHLGSDPYPPGGALGPYRLRSARDLGYCAYGPVLFAFTAWLAAHPEVRALQRLYFLSREGWALRPVFELFRAAMGVDLPDSRYLYASRRAVLLAAQATGLDPARVIDGPEFKGPLSGLLRARLGFDLPPDSPVDSAMRVHLPPDAAKVRSALEALESPIREQAVEEAAALDAYLKQQGIDAADVGVVDVGYRATIQKGLQAVLGRELAGFYMATFPEAAEAGRTRGYFGDRVDPLGEAPIVRHAILLEAFLTAPEGQLDHFRLSPTGAATPVFQPNSRSDAELDSLAELHAGALAYAEDLFRLFGPLIGSLRFNPATAFEPLIALATGRLTAPGSVMKALKVDDAFCGYDEHEVGLDLAGRSSTQADG